MAKRKSINKRLSRYSQRSSAGSGFLDPNSELLGEEEPFWWNKLSNITNSHSAKYNTANETSKYLHSDSQSQSISENHQWWKVLQASDSSQSEGHIEAVQQEIQNKYITSDTDEEDSDRPLRKRKIQIRKRSNRNISNIFKKALDDSRNSDSSNSNLPKNPITKHANDASLNKKSLQESNLIEKQTSQIRNISSTSSIDQSHISDKILKPKHNIFRKKLKKKSYNAFENLLKTNNDSHDKSEKNETTSSDSSAKLMDKKNMSKENILNKSKEEKSNLSSSGTTVFKESIINPETLNYNDNDLIHHNPTNSSFSLSSNSNENLELIPDLILNRSNKSVSKNVSTNQKESSIVEKNANSTMKNSITSKKAYDSTTNEKIESRKTTNKNETSSASMNQYIHTPNKSKMKNSINLRINDSNLGKTINASQRESMNEINLAERISNKNDKYRKISTNMASKNSINLSNSRSIEINDFENKRTASSISESKSNNIIKNNTHGQSFTKKNSMNITEVDVISTENQKHTINSNNNSLHTANAIEDTSENKTLKRKISTLQKTSIRDISDKIEENLSKANNKTPVKDLDMNALSLKQKSLRTMDVIDDIDNEQNADYIDYPNHETSHIINTSYQTKINEYFTTTNSKLVSPINTRQSKHFQILSNIKENKKVKKPNKKVTKPKINISKLINMHFTTVENSSLKRKQIIEKIEELRNMKTQKKSETTKINKAYIVNGEVYKRPKLPRPHSWVTNRLYQFLWKTMQPKYKLLTRVRSEKFVQELSDVVSFITKTKKYKDYETLLNNLMENMATAGIIHTANDFYNFCYDYLPYDFRVKVVPMILPGNVKNIPYDPNTLNEPIVKN